MRTIGMICSASLTIKRTLLWQERRTVQLNNGKEILLQVEQLTHANFMTIEVDYDFLRQVDW